MSRIHYFQRYSSAENTVTNNTLQLISRIYSYSPKAAAKLISQLTGQDIYIGLEITQQTRSGASVPDGTILQRSFRVCIETKVDAVLNIDQLKRHMGNFRSEDIRVLAIVSKSELQAIEIEALNKLRAEFPNVVISSMSFRDICHEIESLFQAHDEEILEVIADYVEYCNDTGLFDQSRDFMRIVPCRESFEINSKYEIYFHPSDRGYTAHSFVGLYTGKAVRKVIKLDAVFDVSLVDGKLTKALVQGQDTDRYDEAIRASVSEIQSAKGWNIAQGHRFFCGPSVDVTYKKTSPGGIQGPRFVNLREIASSYSNLDDLVERLNESTWE